MSELIEVLKMINQENRRAEKPTDITFGTVSSVSPLTIQLEDTMQPIPAAALILTDNVKAKTAEVKGGNGGSVVIREGLSAGNKVIMLRAAKGQRYVILSKV